MKTKKNLTLFETALFDILEDNFLKNQILVKTFSRAEIQKLLIENNIKRGLSSISAALRRLDTLGFIDIKATNMSWFEGKPRGKAIEIELLFVGFACGQVVS